MRAFRLCIAASVLVTAVSGAAQADENPASGLEGESSAQSEWTSHYTGLDLDTCDIDADSEAGWARWRCEGLTGDWPVHVVADDLRYAVSYGENGSMEPAAQQWFGGFYRIHDVLEWMVRRSEADDPPRPVATILRFFLQTDTESDKPREHPILVVTQLKPGAVCHIAYVDARANPNANADARKAARRLAGTFNCEGEAELVGPQSPGVFME